MIAAAVALVLLVVPAPSWTRAEGVVWVPEEAQVRAGTDGFVERLLAVSDSDVTRGQPLVKAEDPFLTTSVAVLEAQLHELGAQYDEVIFADRVKAAMIAEEMAAAEAELEAFARARSRPGFAQPRQRPFCRAERRRPSGPLRHQGSARGLRGGAEGHHHRAVLSQDDIAQVRKNTRSVEVMLADWGASPLPATVRREVPGGSPDLPTAALGTAGGGAFAVDPRDAKGVTTLARVFQLELELPAEVRSTYLGARVYVRFDHGYEPVGFQLYRSFRRLLLSQFDV